MYLKYKTTLSHKASFQLPKVHQHKPSQESLTGMSPFILSLLHLATQYLRF